MGNKNSGRQRHEKPLLEALLMEIKTAEGHKRLRRACRKILELAEQGDLAAFTVIADRLDGKPVQQQEITADTTVRQLPVAMYPADMSPDELEKTIPKLLAEVENNTQH